MPAAPLRQRQANLRRLLKTPGLPSEAQAPQTGATDAAAKRMPICHGAPLGRLKDLLQTGALVSRVQSGEEPHEHEKILGTEDDVYFYVSAFCHPFTESGFLFRAALDDEITDAGVVTPFDSGGLAAGYVRLPAPYGNAVEFVRDHELPMLGYRVLLGAVLAWHGGAKMYLAAGDYFAPSFRAVRRPHPFGLAGGDVRMDTFELRVPQRLSLHTVHLEAIFVPKGDEFETLAPFHARGVKIMRISPEEDNFCVLREACVDYIRDLLTR